MKKKPDKFYDEDGADDVLKKAKRKKRRRRIFLGVVAFLAFVIWYGLQPLQGTMALGVCRTYAQLKLEYPDTFKTISADEVLGATRVYYTFTDAFGGHRSSRIECEFGINPATGLTIAKSIMINGREEPKEKVDSFNKSLPAIASSYPDLTIPFPPKEGLLSLKTD